MSDPFDRQELLDRVDDDIEFLAETVEMFNEDGPPLLSEIRDAIARQDSEALAQAAHTFKGMVANFCADPAVEAARALEMMGKNTNLAGADEAVGRLESEAERLKSALMELVQGS